MSTNLKVIENNSELETILNRDFVKKRSHYIEVGPEKIILPGKFEQLYESVRNFKVRADDVYVFGFIKTGTRWMQELCWLLLNNLDFEKARVTPLWFRTPPLELEFYFDKTAPDHTRVSQIDEYDSPRCIRTHLHWSLLPKAISSGAKQPKIIVLLRGPEDTCTSYYHQAKAVDGYSGNWDDFCKLFLGGKVPFGPYWKHVLALWEQRHRKNMMFIKYSRMKADLSGSIREVMEFLGKDLSDDDVDKLCRYLTFDNLKNSPGFNIEGFVSTLNAHVNPFVRKGIVGDHKNCMSPQVIEAFSKQREQYLKGTGLTLD